MAVALRQSRSFDSASPVTRYWLANCVGFTVRGGGRGTVEDVLAEYDPQEPSALVVRAGRHRVRRVPTSRVVAVVPAERALVVERGPSRTAARARVAGNASARGSAVAARLAARGGVAAARLLAFLLAHGWRLTRRGVAVASPHVARAARDGGTHTVRLVRSVPWQRYARSARSATTRTWQARSQISSHRRTTSSTTSSGGGSED
jgi:hypothetical protein